MPADDHDAFETPIDLASLTALTDGGIADLPFEDAYRILEAAVALLESGELPLESALLVYQRGVDLTRRCGRELEAAELRIREVDGGG